jgi:hypothetical protein
MPQSRDCYQLPLMRLTAHLSTRFVHALVHHMLSTPLHLQTQTGAVLGTCTCLETTNAGARSLQQRWCMTQPVKFYRVCDLCVAGVFNAPCPFRCETINRPASRAPRSFCLSGHQPRHRSTVQDTGTRCMQSSCTIQKDLSIVLPLDTCSALSASALWARGTWDACGGGARFRKSGVIKSRQPLAECARRTTIVDD